MKQGLKETLVGIAVIASGSAGVAVAMAMTGPAATASVQTKATAVSAPVAAIAPAVAPVAAVAPAAVAPAAVPQQFERGYRMATATSTVNCPNMGPHSTTPTSTVAPSAGT